jgi:cell division septal protein FtsQ
MRPRSQARPPASASVTQRRAERRTRRSRVQAQRAPTVRRRRRISVWRLFSWRMVSGMLTAGLVGVLYVMLTTEAFFVRAVAIGGEKHLTREEIFRDSGVARQHVFWVDPQEVAARLEKVPNIADAQVTVGWPPDMVQIVVAEREPALTWEQGIRVWVDVNGIVMKQREDRPDLLRIVVPNPDPDDSIGEGNRIPQSIVDGALYLKRRSPTISVLLYDSIKGLGYHDTRGWTVWFGTGGDMDTKLLVYNQLVDEITGRLQPGEIFMNDPDRPYYTVLWYEGS